MYIAKQSKLTRTTWRRWQRRRPRRPAEKVNFSEKGAVLTALSSMKNKFSSTFYTVLKAIENIRKETSNCTERVSQAELRTSSAEDDVVDLQAKVHTLVTK